MALHDYNADNEMYGDIQKFISNDIQCEAKRGFTGTWIVYVDIPGPGKEIPEIKGLKELGFTICSFDKLTATCHLLKLYDDSYVHGMSEQNKKHYGFSEAKKLADKCTEIVYEWKQLQRGFVPVYMVTGKTVILKNMSGDYAEFILGVYKTEEEARKAISSQDESVDTASLNLVKRFVHKSYNF